MGKTNEQIYNRILHPDLSKKGDLDKFCENMKEYIKDTLSWQWEEKQREEDKKNTFLDSMSEKTKIIENLKEKKLSPLDTKFLTLMERYYLVIANRPTLKTKDHPEQYASYLSIVRDDIAKFYFECAIKDNYDIAHNPIQEIAWLPEILSICHFIEQEYKNKQWEINRKAYRYAYFRKESTKLSRMLDDILNKHPNQQIFSVNIPLLFSIFDLNNDDSAEILLDILTYNLHYSEKKATMLIENYTK